MGHFTRTGKTTLLSDDAGIVKPECLCVARARSATKSLGQRCRIFINLNFLQHLADIGSTWLHVQLPSTSVAERL